MGLSSINNIVARGANATTADNSSVFIALVALISVLIVALSIIATVYIRHRRRARSEQSLPLYSDSKSSGRSNHRRITVRPTESVYVYQEKLNLLTNSDAPLSSPVPEIRITFPEEVDTEGKRQSGRVVVVHVGDTSLGMEPHSNDLPAYQVSESDRFQSLDLERIGGLQEKAIEARWS